MPPGKKPHYSFAQNDNSDVIKETFYDVNKFDWSNELEKNYQIILKEIIEFLEKDVSALKPYFAREMMNAPEKWKAFSFYFWGMKMNDYAIKQCPQTIKLLSGIPNLVSASISIMEPHSEIKPHFGDTNAIFRCHLGLIIPGGLPEIGIRVGYEDRAWETGKLLIFNDANYHKTWNHTGERRMVLLFDVMKPEYADQKKWVCSRVYGNIIWQSISQSTGIFKGKKNSFTKTISWFNAVLSFALFHSLKRKSALL
jgi:ornithine lipid ester-linked acyl 2-hydroxylase